MDEAELRQLLLIPREGTHVEFKEAKNQYDFDLEKAPQAP